MARNKWSTVYRSHEYETGRPGREKRMEKTVLTSRCGSVSVTVVCPHSFVRRCSVFVIADRSPAGTPLWPRTRKPVFYGDEKDAQQFARRVADRLVHLCGGEGGGPSR